MTKQSFAFGISAITLYDQTKSYCGRLPSPRRKIAGTEVANKVPTGAYLLFQLLWLVIQVLMSRRVCFLLLSKESRLLPDESEQQALNDGFGHRICLGRP